jgi:hypothetical protein
MKTMTSLTGVEPRVGRRDEAPARDGELAAARRLLQRDRPAGLAALNALFRAGAVPTPAPDGAYRGELIALDIAPAFTQLATALAGLWLPWQGKRFLAESGQGDNILDKSSYWLAHVFWPLYRGYRDVELATYHAFAFRTYVGPGRQDPDRQVLKLDYDLPDNPALSVRRVVDELIQIDTGLYLGKAHLKWSWGRWQMVAFFVLFGGEA